MCTRIWNYIYAQKISYNHVWLNRWIHAYTHTHFYTHPPYNAKHNLRSESWVHLIIWIFCNMSSVFSALCSHLLSQKYTCAFSMIDNLRIECNRKCFLKRKKTSHRCRSLNIIAESLTVLLLVTKLFSFLR